MKPWNVFKRYEDFKNRVAILEKETTNIDNFLTIMDKARVKSFISMQQSNNEYLYLQNKTINQKKYKKDFNPKVSIIIPVYNGANYVEKAIDSALKQTYKNIEIIVVNDGSKDNTEEVVKKYGKKIKYIAKENGGVSSALNVGIKNMTGDYFAWLSHDDIMLENHIFELVDFLRYFDDGKTIGYSSYECIDAEGSPLGITRSPISCDYVKSLLTRYACILQGDVNGGNVLKPKKAFDKYGGFEEGNKITQEKQMWARLLKEYKFIYIPKITYLIRLHESQVTSTSKHVIEETNNEYLRIIDKITDKEKIEESGSVYNFYNELYEFNLLNGNEEFAEIMKNKLKEL